MKKLFYSTKPGPVGSGTVGELILFLEQLSFFLNPNSGVEYWHPANKGVTFTQAMVPVAGNEAHNVQHTACYIRRGNESPIIEVTLNLQNQTVLRLAWVKLFARKEECWKLVDTITETLDSIIFEKQVPCVLDMFKQVPRHHRYSLVSSLAEVVCINATATSIKVSTDSGLVFADHDLADLGNKALFRIDQIKADWINVLSTTGCRFVETAETALA